MQKDINQERKTLLQQSERETPSQRRISEKIRRELEKKKSAEATPKVRNYNMKGAAEQDSDENSNSNLPMKTRSGSAITNNSNSRRKQS